MAKYLRSFTQNGVQSHVFLGALGEYTVIGAMPTIGRVQHHADRNTEAR